jgi:hypothetical protein
MSRYLAMAAAIAGGALAWMLSWPAAGLLGWVWPMALSILAFGIVGALAQMSLADWVKSESLRAAELEHAPASHGHGGHH